MAKLYELTDNYLRLLEMVQENAPSLKITKEDNIPEEYYMLERKLQRSELLKAIKEGLEVEGVEIKQTESLRIK